MNTDTYFRIGTTHKVCQDFALSNLRVRDEMRRDTGLIAGDPYVIICDGCSESPNSDIGARLLALAARRHLEIPLGDAFLSATGAAAETYCRTLGLRPDAIDATLLVAKVDGDYIKTIVYGDGVEFSMDRDDNLYFCEYRFPSIAPYYLRYSLNKGDNERYHAEFGDKIEMHHYKMDKGAFVVNRDVIPTVLSPEQPYFTHAYPMAETKYVGLASDGFLSFKEITRNGTSLAPEPVNLERIMWSLGTYKNLVGEFAQRRCRKGFHSFAEQSVYNTDDVSVGVIATDKPEVKNEQG